MDLVIYPQHWTAFLCIAIMIGALVFAIIKKWMMTYALIITNIIVFVLTIIFFTEIVYGVTDNVQLYAGLGFRAIYLQAEQLPQLYTLFTSMFIHGGFLHIFGNMLILFFIGLPFEERIGWKKFILIYLLSGIIGTLAYSVLDLGSNVPLIGASGAIFGLMGAFAFSYPRDEVVMPIGIGILFLTRIKVIYAVAFWAVVETVLIWWESTSGVVSGTAHYAHLGGLIGGALLAAIFLRGRKTHTKENKTIYYDSFQAQKPIRINYSNLRKLATTPELKKMLDKIEKENVPQVQDIWLEHFLEKVRCPKCSANLNHFDRRIWCENCGFKEKY